MSVTPPERPYDLLLLDFGGVCLLNPVELHEYAEDSLGLVRGTLDWMGPLDPSTDELWRRMIAGDGLTERDYWTQRAAEVGRLAGRELDLQSYMRLLYEPPRPGLIRQSCYRVVSQAREAEIATAIFTNDMRAFHGSHWERGIPLLRQVEAIVDCSDFDELKPARRAYEWALDRTGFAPGQVLFVDDQPLNVEGARDVGIDALWFDVANAERSWDHVASRLKI